MPPKSVLWKLEDHSLGKHIVLQNYLHAWLPILGTTNQKLLIIDGFSGPGEYANEKKGSPQIMLNSHLEHFYSDKINSQATYYFLEKDPARHKHLQNLITEKFPTLPSNVSVQVHNDTFDEHITQLLDDIDQQNKNLAPCFAMIDPFGVSDTPMSLIQRLLSNPKSEIYISLMYEHINRFKKQPEFKPHLTNLFGTDKWINGVTIECKNKRRAFFNDLYKAQLKKAGATQVVHFELYNGNRHVYTIFFATKHWKGADKMKAAIWRVIPDGSFRFKGNHSNDLITATDKDFNNLYKQVKTVFHNQWIFIDSLLQFIGSDQTDFSTDGIKKKFLKELEKQKRIEVNPKTRKRNFSYPSGTQLRFL